MQILIIVALSLHIVSTTAHARNVAADAAASQGARHQGWDAVLALAPGARIEIENRAGEFLGGRLRSANDDHIVIDTGKAAVDVPRSSVGRVVLIGPRQTGRRARQGFLIGAVLGTAVTAIGRAPAAWILFVGASWGALGSALGAADGASTRARTVIYQAGP